RSRGIRRPRGPAGDAGGAAHHRRQEAPRTRPRARGTAAAPPPRRGTRGSQPDRDRAHAQGHPQHPRARGRHPDHRASHAGDHGPLRPHRGAELGAEACRGHAGRDRQQCRGDRGLSRRPGARREAAWRHAAMSEALLQVEGLATGYGEVQVLWGLSLAAARGRLTTLVGANGAGKTTMLRAVVGTLAPWSGRVLFKGEDVTRLPAHAKAARGLVLVPEGRQLFSNMTVDENLEMGAFTRRGADGYADRLERV